MFLPKRWQIFFTVFVIAAIFAGSGCDRVKRRFQDVKRETNGGQFGKGPDPSAVPDVNSVHLAFGNPSNAANSDVNNYLIVGEGSVISYNNSRGTANWISWKTTANDLGERLERPDFRPDPRLPSRSVTINYYDYSGSGYDRGHLVPSADRFANPKLNEETFLMTNIVPQTAALNQYPWNKLESYARAQARKGFDVYQIAGVYGTIDRLKGKITVPESCWKIIALVPKGKSVRDLDRRMRIIAVDMPNVDGIENKKWETYKTTIRNIEQKTGLDMFSDLPKETQDTLETKMEIFSTSR